MGAPESGQRHVYGFGQIPMHNHVLGGNEGSSESKSAGNVRLSLYLRNGKVVLMNSCGDQQATIIRTGLVDGKMLWSGDGSILAVSGFRKSQSMSTIRFFRPSGQLLFTLPLRTKVGRLLLCSTIFVDSVHIMGLFPRVNEVLLILYVTPSSTVPQIPFGLPGVRYVNPGIVDTVICNLNCILPLFGQLVWNSRISITTTAARVCYI